jgi:hypothetical protein
VRAAERRVELSKQQVRERWDGLRLRARDALVSPAALGTFALVGGVIGWRSARSSTEKRNATHPREARRASAAGSVLRGVASGFLQTLAAVAVEEALKSGIKGEPGEVEMASKQ